MNKRVPLLLAFALLISRGLAQVDEAVESAELPPPAPEVSVAPAQPEVQIKEEPDHTSIEKGKSSSGYDTLSVDFPDEEIRMILRNVADLFELNLIIPETLQGRASIKLRDVSWRQIFESVLDPVGYTYVEDANIIKVVSKESLNDEPVTTEVFMLNFARAADVMPTVSSLVDPARGKIMVDGRSNSLVITERPTRMSRIRPILEKLDRATDQVMIESKFVEVTDEDTKNVGINWSSLGGYNVSAGPFSRSYSNENGRVTSRERTETNIDVPYMRDGYNRAADVAGVPRGSIGPPREVDSDTGAVTYPNLGPGSKDVSNYTGDLSRLTTAVFNADKFGVVLSALQTLNNTKVVSNPTVVTLNNTEATINVGEERPIPNYAYSEQTGTFQISGFTYKPIGVILKVTPQVNAQGLIKLTVSPEVSQTTSSVSFGGASATEIPVISTRKATTQVSLKDGYTMAIGGLLTQNLIKGETKVPVLGSIPGLGRLFRSDSKDTTTKNLIIFITAKSINAEGASSEEIFSSEQIRQLNMRKEDLPGYRDGSDPWVKDPPPDEKDGDKKAKKAARKK
ncbi:MAG: hypothetical protein NVV63_01510 [Opitutus sp.]|nr:hypothetical protein [Opitutus sp.]